MALVELRDVEKFYGDLHALKSVTLTLEAGRIGLLGPNGAGKSTFLKSLLGLVIPTSGTVKVFDLEVARNPFEVRARVGYMPEGDHVMPELTALEYASFAAKLCGLPDKEAVGRAHLVLQYVGLGEARYRKLGSYSTGMRQRARLAQALVGDPKLLLLDEPTSGLDPRGRDEMLALIHDIPTRTGASVILSTHILPDVEKTCDQVIVLAGGQALYAGALAPLIRPEEGIFEVRTKGDPARLRTALELSQCIVTMQGTTLEVRVPHNGGAAHVVRVAVEAGCQLRHLAPLQHTLERAFFETLEKAASPTPA
ncbi:MAG: ABC transporter ATP-binding protein [Sandaracinaceae bacterium]|nr:ABC transporter ATP-binding protein [Sandaracinaceae bacterium]